MLERSFRLLEKSALVKGYSVSELIPLQSILVQPSAQGQRSARALFAELMAGFESYQRGSKERIPVASAFNAEIQPAKASSKKRHQ